MWCSTSKEVFAGKVNFEFFYLMYTLRVFFFFLIFKMTAHLSKLIKALKFYNWKRIKNSYRFLIIFWMFSSISTKAHSHKVPLLMCCITFKITHLLLDLTRTHDFFPRFSMSMQSIKPSSCLKHKKKKKKEKHAHYQNYPSFYITNCSSKVLEYKRKIKKDTILNTKITEATFIKLRGVSNLNFWNLSTANFWIFTVTYRYIIHIFGKEMSHRIYFWYQISPKMFFFLFLLCFVFCFVLFFVFFLKKTTFLAQNFCDKLPKIILS